MHVHMHVRVGGRALRRCAHALSTESALSITQLLGWCTAAMRCDDNWLHELGSAPRVLKSQYSPSCNRDRCGFTFTSACLASPPIGSHRGHSSSISNSQRSLQGLSATGCLSLCCEDGRGRACATYVSCKRKWTAHVACPPYPPVAA